MSTRISNTPRTYALDHFLSYMGAECYEHFSDDSSLADYIDHWLWDRGAAMCFGDFEIFLKTIPLIVDEWHKHPRILHFGGCETPQQSPFERQATSTFGSGEELHRIFDRDNFTAAYFNWRHFEGRNSEPTY